MTNLRLVDLGVSALHIMRPTSENETFLVRGNDPIF